MASDAGVRNIEQLALFGKNIKSLGQNMYSTMQVAQQRMNAVSEGWQDKQNDKFREQFNRSVQDMKKMSEMSGVQIIACSGFFMEPFPMLGDFTAKDFAEGFIHEILNGVGDTGIKPGILKTAMDTEGPTRGREVIHRAV